MKRCMLFIALLLVTVMLLSACAGSPEQPKGTDDTTVGSNAESTAGSNTDSNIESTAGSGTDSNVDSTVGNKENTADDPVGLHTEKDYEAFINNEYWYRRALGCTFEKPEDISAYFYFYLGVGSNEQAKDEELAFILDAFRKKNPSTENTDYAHNYIRLPVDKINEALSVLGVTVEDIQIPDRWVYYDQTDAYYFWVSDAYGVGKWSVTKVEKDSEGKVAVYWEPEGSYLNTATGAFVEDAKMVMTLQEQADGTFRILSNVPQA